MLEDEALSEGAFHAIEAGVPADHAWHEAMAAEIPGLCDGRGRIISAPGQRI